MRPLTACSKCRSGKRKCTVPDEGGPCNTCRTLGVPCSLASASEFPPLLDETAVINSPNWSFATGSADLMPDASVCNELVDIYFDLMHDKQHALFHRPTFIAEQRLGRAPMMLVAAIMALAARFSSNPYFDNIDPWARGRAWTDYSKKLFDTRVEPVSLSSAQACVLLSGLAFIEGDMAMESLYGVLAIRMVQLLDLPNRLSTDVVERETEIRVWWSIWMMDKWSAAGARLPQQLALEPGYPKPMEEVAFEALMPGAPWIEIECMADSIRLRDFGLWAQMIPLTEIIGQINDIHEMTVQHRMSQSQLYDSVQAIANKLDSWRFRLPKELQITTENLARYNIQGHGRTLVALHLGYYHQNQLLYYQFLHDNCGTSPNRALSYVYASRCKEYATELSTLLWTANSTPGCECLWVVTGHLLVVSSTIHLHTLLFDSNDLDIENAKTMLKQNFELMIQLRKYWPSLDLSMSRLRVFHRACQKSMNTSFAMDKWMLQFLQRYMKPVRDKHELSPPEDASNRTDSVSSEPNLSPERLWYGDNEEGSSSEILESFL